MAASNFAWRRTNAPIASSRTDDIHFVDSSAGWAVNSNGQILKTADGGSTWTEQLRVPDAYLRCVAFANPQKGWAGTLSTPQRLYATSDGGENWRKAENLPAIPSAICGLCAIDEQTVYASGTNFPDRVPAVIKTFDGGQTWTAIDMSSHASLLVDIYFKDSRQGWVVGGKANDPNRRRNDVQAVILYTGDGGKNWTNLIAGLSGILPKGEWGWKIFFLNESIGFVSLENFKQGAILKTEDGGMTWERKEVNDPQHNANLEGIGFVDAKHGWAGGWGTPDFSGGFSSETLDGGATWRNANQIGRFLNRFRFFHEPAVIGYASGDTVYKYSAEPVPKGFELVAGLERSEPITTSGRLLKIGFTVPPGSGSVTIDIWDRFGEHLSRLVEQRDPVADAPTLEWSGTASPRDLFAPGYYIYRVSTDDHVESHVVRVV